MTHKIINAHVIDALKGLEDESVDCVITSPPYYGLRSYKGADTVWGGNPDCEHDFSNPIPSTLLHENRNNRRGTQDEVLSNPTGTTYIRKSNSIGVNAFCSKCGAWKGQLGLEPTYQLYIEHLMLVTREIKRVLKKTGTLFWNMGDSYAGNMSWTEKYANKQQWHPEDPIKRDSEIQSKSLMMIPERFALAMIDDGWILRNKICWYKRNSLPASVKDRLTNKWEYVFFFTKSKKYYFDLDAIRKPASDPNWMLRVPSRKKYVSEDAKDAFMGNPPKGLNRPRLDIKNSNGYSGIFTAVTPEEAETFGSPRARNLREGTTGKRSDEVAELFKNDTPIPSKYIQDMEAVTASPAGRVMRNLVNGKTTTLVREPTADVNQYLKDRLNESSVSIKELAEISGEPETEIAHYFRTDESGRALPSREFWDKVKGVLGLEEYDKFIKEERKSIMLQFNPKGSNPGDVFDIPTKPHKFAHFAIYPETLVEPLIKAGCPPGGTVLDPFAGSGTTGVVAEKLGRNSILIEISSEYVKIIEARMAHATRQLTLL